MRKIRILSRSLDLEWILLFAIVAVGVFLRLEAQRHLIWIEPDGVAYVDGAVKALSDIGDFGYRGPLYQFLLLTSYRIFGASYETSLIIPQFFGCILPILFFFVGKRFFDSETGLITALLISLNPFLIILSCWVFRETLALTLILMIILVGHSAIEVQSKKRSMIFTILLGFLSGLLILTREEMIFIISPACIAFLYICEKKRSDFMVRTTVFLAITIITITPWLLYSSAHFGDPFYSYAVYMKGFGNSGNPSSATDMGVLQRVFSRTFFGLWKVISEMPATFAFVSLAFLPIGIMLSIRKRVTWIIYFIMGLDLLIIAYFSGGPLYFHELRLPYMLHDPNRYPVPAVMPVNVIIAYGIKRFIHSLTGPKGLRDIPTGSNLSHRSRAKGARPRKPKKLVIDFRSLARTMNKSKSLVIFLGLLITLGAVAYVTPYTLILEDFDNKTFLPFIESAEFLNSIGGTDGVFTLHPELLAKYYKGPIYQLPDKGGFEHILDEAKKKGAKYLIIDSASVNSVELIDLFYYSVNPYWREIPSEFELVKAQRWQYGIYRLISPRFKAAIFGHLEWDAQVPWQTILTSLNGSTRTFDDTTIVSDVNLSEFDVVVFADFSRSIDDAERLYLEESIQNGLVAIVSGLSPEKLAGGTTNLTRISTWFGATFHTEAPKEARWKVKFTENATEIMSGLDLDHEYAFYKDSDWSTPIGALVEPESVVYAYRVNDSAPTIFVHEFGQGTSLFVGPRFGFASIDKEVFESFIQSLILSVLD